MNARTALLFGVHAHQPAGNFPEVLVQAHERCYGPFLRTVFEYPGFCFSIHLSGPLLDFLYRRFPADMALLAAMARRGQAEIFGAGDTEPVLAAIPNRDRIGQIETLSAKIEARFGRRPQGAWLTERVWEATVVPALADCGIRYVAVDDYHFLCTGRGEAELGGCFSTEEDGRSLDLFPISERLRYAIPFAPAADAVAAIERIAGAAVYFDDLEKFGIWPETHEWVYGKGWLRDFIARVLASPKIETLTYRDFHRRERSRGVVYLPTTSYIEMNEWSLPAAAAAQYADLVLEQKHAGRYEARKAFVRGGIWKNFLSRYPESNWMHKRMLSLSERLASIPAPEQSASMRGLLYASQANDAYWHGLFGGLYLPHLRRAIYSSLIRLEALLDRIAPRPPRERLDLDHDGADELFLRNALLQVAIRLDGSAALCELDSYALSQNFGDTLRRHAEHYHARIGSLEAAAPQGSGIASAHDRVSVKHAISSADMAPDSRARTLFADSWADGVANISADTGAEAAPGASADPGADAAARARPISSYALDEQDYVGSGAAFRASAGDHAIEKRVVLEGETLRVSWRTDGRAGTLRTEIDLAMPSCDGFSGRYIHQGGIPGGFGQPLAIERLEEITLDDRHLGGSVVLRCDPPARFSAAPCYTVSQSEDGFEKVMQSVSLSLQWQLAEGDTQVCASLRVVVAP